jgi:hypothetical protein
VHIAAYAVPSYSLAMNTGGDGYLPPPPPRSPGSAGSGSFPHRRVPPPPPTITTALGGPGQQPGSRSGTTAASYSYPYSPSTTLNTPSSPCASTVLSPLSQSSTRGDSPRALRPPTGSTMVAEYNPQQWGRGDSIGVQHRPFNTAPAASRALDESGGMTILSSFSYFFWESCPALRFVIQIWEKA